jgi:hypothetical protein
MLGFVFLAWGRTLPTTHWTGSLFVFGMLTVQFTWGATLGVILGPSRRLRRWYWASLVFAVVPLEFTRMVTWLSFHFVGLQIAILCALVCLSVIVIETVAGVMVGNNIHSRLLAA